jgi:predicted TIM-barrel fold metal-dependent hydrolase
MSDKLDDHAVLVTCDTHVGPRLIEDLRPYCPQGSLADFDEFAEDTRPVREWWLGADAPGSRLAGHYDSAARRKDMEGDGVVAEVLFHFSFNGELLPFIPSFTHSDNPSDPELAKVGMRIYNRWLADFCAELPGRRVGLAHLPLWDIDAAVAEAEWAAEHGLKGINFPAMRDTLLAYDEPAYEPLWDVAEANGLALTTHSGAVSPTAMSRQALLMLEVAGPAARRAIHRFIFAKIFDRHPDLKLVMTEMVGPWQQPLMDEMDSAYRATVQNNAKKDTGALTRNANRGVSLAEPGRWKGYAVNTLKQEPLDKLPSEYFGSNVFIGASMLAHFEAELAIEHGYVDSIMWGSDYPHPEGLRNPADSDPETSQFRRAVRNTFQNLPGAQIRGMLGDNAIRCYGLDGALLQDAANQIGAPSVAALATPPVGDLVGSGGTGGLAFRTEAWT